MAMIPILWTERTAFPGQSHDTANSSGDTFRFVDKPTQLTEDFETLRAFFDDSVVVKHLDLTDCSPPNPNERALDLMHRYGALINANFR